MELVEKLGEALGAEKTIETAVSWVVLTGKSAFKLKKRIKIEGLLDYSTLEKRRECVRDELKLNRELCPELYEGVVEVGDFVEDGEGELALKMKRVPDNSLLSDALARGEVTERVARELARLVADFHGKARIDREHGGLENVKKLWEDHREAMASFGYDHETIYSWAERFMKEREGLFAERVAEGKSRDCHGDLHSGNVFFFEGNLWVFDRIEFNEAIRCSDVASEVAFMAMDLEFHGFPSLSDAFVEEYVAETGDSQLFALLPFYKSHRAYVRGKIATWAGEKERAESYFSFARGYSTQ